jgi:hypothetical protein
MPLDIYMRRQFIVVHVQDELRNELLPHIMKWPYLMLNVMVFDKYDPMKHTNGI